MNVGENKGEKRKTKRGSEEKIWVREEGKGDEIEGRERKKRYQSWQREREKWRKRR